MFFYFKSCPKRPLQDVVLGTCARTTLDTRFRSKYFPELAGALGKMMIYNKCCRAQKADFQFKASNKHAAPVLLLWYYSIGEIFFLRVRVKRPKRNLPVRARACVLYYNNVMYVYRADRAVRPNRSPSVTKRRTERFSVGHVLRSIRNAVDRL